MEHHPGLELWPPAHVRVRANHSFERTTTGWLLRAVQHVAVCGRAVKGGTLVAEVRPWLIGMSK